jgi:hypothetical protein
MSAAEAAIKNAWAMGAKGRRLGHPVSRCFEFLNRPELHAAYALGWWTQRHRVACVWPDEFHVLFDMALVNSKDTVRQIVDATKRKDNMMTTRSAEELERLKSEFRSTYTGDDAGFDDAFASHLASIDAAADGGGSAATTGAKAASASGGKKAGAKSAGKKAAAKPAKAAAAKPAKAAKAPAAPKAKAFRPTSDDRKVLNAAAAKAAGKSVKTPRLLPQTKGGTYTEFLQGKVLKLDANGNGSATLNVVAASDTSKVVGTVNVTVTKGVMKASAGSK